MTSPNFTYPHPTDDELAAQVPNIGPAANAPGVPDVSGIASGTVVPGVPVPGTAAAPSSRLGQAALIVKISAAVLSLIASVILGATVGPMEADYGSSSTGMPAWFTGLGVTLFGLQGLCALAGLTGLGLGIAALATNRGRTQGIIAIAVAVVAPLVSFAVFIVLSFALA